MALERFGTSLVETDGIIAVISHYVTGLTAGYIQYFTVHYADGSSVEIHKEASETEAATYGAFVLWVNSHTGAAWRK